MHIHMIMHLCKWSRQTLREELCTKFFFVYLLKSFETDRHFVNVCALVAFTFVKQFESMCRRAQSMGTWLAIGFYNRTRESLADCLLRRMLLGERWRKAL